MDKDNNRPQIPQGDKKPFKPKFNFYWIYMIIGFLLIATMFIGNNPTTRDEPYSKLEQLLNDGCISKLNVIISKNKVDAEVKPGCAEKVFGESFKGKEDNIPHINTLVPSVEEFSKTITQLQKDGKYSGEVSYVEGKDYWSMILMYVFPILLLVAFFAMMNNRMSSGGGPGGIFNVGKSKAQVFDKNSTSVKITFKDVAGLESAKQEVEEIVEFLRKPQKYTELGGKIPKGALLVGPPGTGKTLLAKAVAGEANVPFFSMSGSDFVEMFVGVGASRVRDLFRQAKEKAPCIVFIDEIDAVGRARSKNAGMGGNDERENTLNQLLTEMDGFGSNSGVIIMAATNRADILDKALLRAGRFDRQIHVELPDVHERIDIFKVHMRPLKMDNSVDIDFLARQTPGFSGADIANVCNEAALIAARHEHKAVGKQDFLDAVDRIVGGLEKKSKIITQEEKTQIAFHEAGHATISWKLRYANPLVKVSIVPRGEALGAAWYLPEERPLSNKEQLLDEMCAILGGRAAEEIFFNTSSTGALNDLERATKRAYAMVAYYGMSDTLANISYFDSSGNSDYGFTKPYSEKTAEAIDLEAKKIVEEQYQRAKKILLENKDGHNKMAKLLIEKEVLFAEDVKEILGERPWKSRADEILDLSEENKKNSSDTAVQSNNNKVAAAPVVTKEGKGGESDVQSDSEPDENKKES